MPNLNSNSQCAIIQHFLVLSQEINELLSQIAELLPANSDFLKILNSGDILYIYSTLYSLSEEQFLNRDEIRIVKKLFDDEIKCKKHEELVQRLYLKILASVQAHALVTKLDKQCFYHC